MHVALLTRDQHESMVDLLCELNAYYHEADPASREAVRHHFFKNLIAPASPLLLAAATGENGKVLGFAAFFFVHSLVESNPERSRQCTLKELFVSAAARSGGVGKALVSWVARHALEHGCCRIDWPVNSANHRGIAFYEGLGAERQVERISHRLSGESMARLANEAAVHGSVAGASIEQA